MFAFTGTASATEYIQGVHNVTETPVYGTAGQVIGTGFTNNEKLTEISVYSDEGTLANINMAIYKKDTPITNWGAGEFGTYIFLNWRDGTTPTYSDGQWHFNMSGVSDEKRTLETGYYYFISFNFGGGSPQNFYGSSSNTWENGESHRGTYNGVWENTANIVDLGFSFTTDGISAPSYTLEFNEPLNNGEISDFTDWGLDLTSDEYIGMDFYHVVVNYGEFLGDVDEFSDTLYTSGGNLSLDIEKTENLPFGFYQAEAELYDKDNNLVLTTDPIVFEILPSIIFDIPESAETLEDFTHWVLQSSLLPSYTGTDFYNIEVLYSNDNFSTHFTDEIYTQGGGAIQFGIAKSRILAEDEWKAYVFLKDFEGAVIYTSEEITFNVVLTLDPNLPPIPEPPVCDTGNVVGDAVCIALNFMFVPSQQSTAQFATLWTPIKEKVPFGYLTLTLDAFADLHNGADAYELPEIPIIENTIKPIVVTALWLFFGVYLIKRIGKMAI